jgi:ammonium transporter, Amt family
MILNRIEGTVRGDRMTFDTGNTGFMLIATSLVMLMTPGLAFFYGGLVGRKNVLAIMIQSFVSMAVVDVIWFAVGYSLCFSGDVGGIYGNLDQAFLRGIGPDTAFSSNNNIPLYVFIAYQMMFAIITPALITGAFANRVKFKAYLIFLVAWLLFVYIPFVHMVWGGGMLAQWGVKDFAGGIVVHAIAGMGALASVLFIGARKVKEASVHSIPLVALGTGLLWFGWYGFNAGSELQVDSVTAVAFINTDLAASVAATVWLIMAWIFEKKPKLLGLLTGSIAGLATITPCAGFVSPTSAMIIGMMAGIICYIAIWLKNYMKWDDALDVWGVHGVGGIMGTILLGVFADLTFNPNGADGLLRGNPHFLGVQTAAVILASVWGFAFTYVMLWLINKITPVRVTKKEEELGLDEAEHGEVAYQDDDGLVLIEKKPSKKKRISV